MFDMDAARRVRVGLLWHSPNSGNLGVGALTVANLSIVRQVAEEVGIVPSFVIIGMRDAGARYISENEASTFGIDIRKLLSPSGSWAVIRQQDCILDIGAGDSFAEIYGAKRFAFLWLTKLQALVSGIPLILSPQTIGPFSRALYVQLARIVLTRARAVVARDDISYEFLRKIAPKANGVLSVDVAFALPFEDKRGGAERAGPIRVGVNVSGLLFSEATSGRNRFGLEADYAKLMRQFVRDLVAREDVELHLLTHANGAGDDDDGWAVDQLASEFPSAIRVPDFASPSAAKSYISGLDFLVAGRMHACIAAYSAGTPVVPVAYSRKFSGLFGMLRYPWLVPVRGMDNNAALSYLHSCLDRRDELRLDEARGMRQVEVMLDAYRAELRRLFELIAVAK